MRSANDQIIYCKTKKLQSLSSQHVSKDFFFLFVSVFYGFWFNFIFRFFHLVFVCWLCHKFVYFKCLLSSGVLISHLKYLFILLSFKVVFKFKNYVALIFVFWILIKNQFCSSNLVIHVVMLMKSGDHDDHEMRTNFFCFQEIDSRITPSRNQSENQSFI